MEKEAQLINETPLHYEGQLLKFTNVVKGFQHRWFVINNKLGTLDYFEKEEHKRTLKARGSISLIFADVCPAVEDCQTFNINAKTGNYFKLKALNTKDRQEWIDNLRSSISYFNKSIQNGRFGANSISLRFRNGIDDNSTFYSSNSLNASGALDLIYGASNISASSLNDDIFDPIRTSGRFYSLKANHDELVFNREPFKNVNNLIIQMDEIYMNIVKDIDMLAVSGPNRIYFDQNLLLTKATCAATIDCLKKCVTLIRNKGLFNSKLINRKCEKPNEKLSPLSNINMVSDSKNVGSVSSLPAAISEEKQINGDDIDNSTILSAQSHDELTNKISKLVISSNQSSSSINSHFKFLLPIEAMDVEPCNPIDLTLSIEDSDCYEKIQSEKDILCLEENKSLIRHLISQVKLGMDLTKVTLPTFILEKRSLLEMFSDYMAHPDLFLRITDEDCPEKRFKALVLWYMTSFHAGRKGSIAKKPYNPIIGETFHCMWHVPDKSCCHHLNFSAEQVSHHPPITAFYLECPSKGIRLNASIHTKSKFQGISITAQMVGKVIVYVDKYAEEYQFTFPNAHAKNILSVPKMEFGDKVTISSLSTKYSASIVFHSKPLFGNSSVNKITGEIKDPENQVIEKISGDWSGVIEMQNLITNQIISTNVSDLPLYKKFLNPETVQKNHESRKLWRFVTEALYLGDNEKATKYKSELENRQRQSEKIRITKKLSFPVKYFQSNLDGRWTFKSEIIHKTKSCDN